MEQQLAAHKAGGSKTALVVRISVLKLINLLGNAVRV
jgi:hypothetical protein